MSAGQTTGGRSGGREITYVTVVAQEKAEGRCAKSRNSEVEAFGACFRSKVNKTFLYGLIVEK